MLDQYSRFFTTATTASAAFAGLLFVAVSVVNMDDSRFASRERRMVLAGGAFLAIVDVFFVALISSFGGVTEFAITSLVMSVAGLLGTGRLITRAARAGNFGRGFPERMLNLVFSTVAVGCYSAQLALSVALLANRDSRGVTRALVFVMVALFAAALGRGWEVAGIGHRGHRPD